MVAKRAVVFVFARIMLGVLYQLPCKSV